MGISGFQVIVGRPAACIHRPYRVAFKFCARGKGRPAEHVNGPAFRKWSTRVPFENVSRKIKVSFVGRDSVKFD